MSTSTPRYLGAAASLSWAHNRAQSLACAGGRSCCSSAPSCPGGLGPGLPAHSVPSPPRQREC
eukprot:2433107-Pyramimonas_sp.AAC.1